MRAKIYSMKSYPTGSRRLKHESRVHCGLFSRFSTIFLNEIWCYMKWLIRLLIPGSPWTFFIRKTWSKCGQPTEKAPKDAAGKTHLYRPSCLDQVHNRLSSRRCSPLALERSDRFHTHSGFHILPPGDLQNLHSVLIGQIYRQTWYCCNIYSKKTFSQTLIMLDVSWPVRTSSPLMGCLISLFTKPT